MALRREIKTKIQDVSLTRYHIGPATIYLDDIELIYETLLKAANAESGHSPDCNNPDSVIIKAGEARADIPSDLCDAKPKELQEVRIAIRHPAITVTFRRRISTIWADSEGKDLAAGIRDFINSRRSFFSSLYVWDNTIWLALLAALAASRYYSGR